MLLPLLLLLLTLPLPPLPPPPVDTTTATCASIEERDDKGFYVFESVSVNGDGAETVRGTWTNIVRGG